MRSGLTLPLAALGAALCAPTAAAQTFRDLPTQIPGGTSNSSSTENVDWADVDGDGDYDAVFADGGDGGNDRNRIWINVGGLQGGTIGFFADATNARLPAGLDTSRDVDFVDLDNDGDQDLYVSNTSTSTNQSNRFWVNQGGAQGGTPGFFTDESATRWVNVGQNDGVTTFSSVAPGFALPGSGFVDWSCDCVFGDLDNDGDLDLVHTSYGGIFGGDTPSRLFLNDGSGHYEEFNPSGFQLQIQDISNGDPALWAMGTHQNGTTDTSGAESDVADTPLGVEIGDLDQDWDIDILQGARNEVPRIYKNRLSETGSFVAFQDVTHSAQTQLASGGGNYEQELGDMDNDNDLDIYGLNWTGLSDIVSLNDGAGTFGSFTTLPNSSADDNEGDYFDFNNDGNLDIFVCNFSGQDKLYENSGAPGYSYTNVTGPQLVSSPNIGLGADSIDIDNDGDYDLMIANDNNQANRLLINITQIADTHAPRVVPEQAPDQTGTMDPAPIRARVYDNASWDVARYGTTVLEYTVNAGAVQTVPMLYMGGQMWRGVIPGGLSGTIAYTVKATDQGGNTGTSATLSYSVSGGTVNYCTAGTSAAGCVASLTTTGTPSATAATGFNFVASGVEGQKDGLFFWGVNGRQANPWGSSTSYQCVVPPVFRGGLQVGSGTLGACDGSFSQDMNARWTAKPAQNPGSGTLVQGQLWYRDPFNTSNQTTSLSDAIEFTVQP